MMFTQEKIAHRVSWFLFICLAIQVTHSLAAFTDVPPPPARPARFNSREELKRYLQLVHEYYAIIGRPRFGRSPVKQTIDPMDQSLYRYFDSNSDEYRTLNELPIQSAI